MLAEPCPTVRHAQVIWGPPQVPPPLHLVLTQIYGTFMRRFFSLLAVVKEPTSAQAVTFRVDHPSGRRDGCHNLKQNVFEEEDGGGGCSRCRGLLDLGSPNRQMT